MNRPITTDWLTKDSRWEKEGHEEIDPYARHNAKPAADPRNMSIGMRINYHSSGRRPWRRMLRFSLE